MTLEDRLERLANRTPPSDPATIFAAAREQADAASAPRRGGSRLLAAAAVVAIVLVGAGALALSGDDRDSITAADPDGDGALDGPWTMTATVSDGEIRVSQAKASVTVDGDSVVGDDGCGNRLEATLVDGRVSSDGFHTLIGCVDEQGAEDAERFWHVVEQQPQVETRGRELWLVAEGGDALVFHRPDAGQAEPAVSAAADGLGPIAVSTSDLTPSEQGWLQHTVTLENTGTDAVHLNDFRTGTVLGDREAVAATDGCGYGSALGEPAVPACRYNYEPVTIEAGMSHSFTVTLWRDLDGMNPVGDRPFEWRLAVQVGDAPFQHPDDTGTAATITMTYRDLAAAGTSVVAVDDEGVRVLPSWAPDGYRLAWVDTPSERLDANADMPLTERPHDYAYGYQTDSAELEVRVMAGAALGDPQAVADRWNDLAAPTTIEGRLAVGYTDGDGYTQLLVAVDGGVAMVTTHPLGESFPAGRNPAMPSRDVVDRFAGSLAAVSEATWTAALDSGVDVASAFGPKVGRPVIHGDGWTLMNGEFRAPLSVSSPAMWVDFGDDVGGAAGPGVIGEDGASHAAVSVHDGNRVAWGIVPGGARTVTVTIGGSTYEVDAVEAAGMRAFAVEVTGSRADSGTFEAVGADGALVVSGPIHVD